MTLAEELNPISLRPKVLSAWTIYQTRDFENAAKKGYELLQLNPEFMQSHLQLSNILLEMGKYEEALEHAKKPLKWSHIRHSLSILIVLRWLELVTRRSQKR